MKRSQWKYAQHLANFGSDSWQRLVIQWEPAFVLDMSLEFAPHRGRGRPRTRWYDDLTKFAEQTWDSSDWFASLSNSSAQYLQHIEDAYIVFSSPI